MKKGVILTLVILFGVTVDLSARAQDPITAIIAAGIKRVIVAVDLKIQRLQNKTIALQNAQKAIENTMSQLKLDEITSWVERQKQLYQDYFQELYKVKDVLTYYNKARNISELAVTLVKAYHSAWSAVQQDRHFTADELLYMGQVYSGMLEESRNNLEQAALVLKSFTTQMSDARRMSLIDEAAAGMEQTYNDLKRFNTQTINLSLGRAKDAHDVTVLKSLYGIQ